MQCPKCLVENSEDSSFCQGCGRSIFGTIPTPAKACRNSHGNTHSDVRFCNKCGRDLCRAERLRIASEKMPGGEGGYYPFAVIVGVAVVSLSLLSFYLIRNSEPSGDEIFTDADYAAFIAWWAGAVLAFIILIVAFLKSFAYTRIGKALTAAFAIGAIALGSSCYTALSGGHV